MDNSKEPATLVLGDEIRAGITVRGRRVRSIRRVFRQPRGWAYGHPHIEGGGKGMTKTRQDLINRTLELLNALASGQNPEPEDVQTIDDIIDGKLLELNRREIYWSSDRDEFEDEFVGPLATILANEKAPSFGQPRSPDSQAIAEATLLAMKDSTYVSGSTLGTDYF